MSKYTEKELNALLERYNGFIHMMTLKFHKSLRTYDFEDLLQEFRMKFVEGAEIHDEEKGKLTTFTGTLMKNHFIILKRFEMAQKRPDFLLTLDEDISLGEEGDTFVEIAQGLYENELTPHEQFLQDKLEKEVKTELSKMPRGFITEDYFLNEMGTNEIAEKYKISPALVKYTNKINIMKLRNKFKDYITDNFDSDKFDIDDFNDTYDKEFFDGK